MVSRDYLPYVSARRLRSLIGLVRISPRLPMNGRPGGSGMGMDSAIVKVLVREEGIAVVWGSSRTC